MTARQQGNATIGVAGLLAMLVFLLLSASAAFAAPQPFEVREYQRDFDVSPQRAERVLEIQQVGTEADIAGQLEAQLGSDYAGIWFDNETGEFVVPLAPGAERGTAARALNAAGLSGQFRFVSVESSWEELDAAQGRIDQYLQGSGGLTGTQTSLDSKSNAVLVAIPDTVPPADVSRLLDRLGPSLKDVELVRSARDRTYAGDLYCLPSRVCGLPLRGGVRIEARENGEFAGFCSTGFKAIGNTNGNRYILTAGHCADTSPYWYTEDAEHKYPGSEVYVRQSIGTVEQFVNHPVGDWAKFNAAGTYWDQTPWPSEVAYWGYNQDWAITGQGQSFQGQYVCHSGATTGTSCGYVRKLDTSVWIPSDQVWQENLTEFGPTCAEGGDSGGSIFANHAALGIVSLGTINAPECQWYVWYHEINEITAALNVSVAPRAPRVTVQASALNGNPGWVTLKGNVTAPGVTITNKQVNVKLFKWNASTSDWDEKASLPATVTNGAYEIKNWEGVGPGAWIAKAVFPAQEPFAEATSDEVTEGSFEVKDGYQLISTVSGKCADVQYSSLENGAPVWQFGCWSPVRAGQVFWIKPISGPYVQLINKNSKKCMETRNVSQTAGETMQQWSCGWLAQESQLWQKVDVAGGSKFVVKHSGQCLDLYLSGTQDGNKIDQHPCNGTNAQVWQVKSVNSEPAKPEVFLTISGVQPGQPGFFDISGNVKQGDYPVNGKPVFIDFERLVGSVWQKEPGLTKEVKADSTGYYVLVNNFVGRGTYRAHARLNSELPLLGGAESGNHQFQIGMGYRLASKLAPNKCLSVNNGSWNQGAPILLWDCSPNPQGGDGQVITWSPVNGIWPHRQIVFNGSKLCLDVPGVKQDDGLQLQQWACNVAGQDNQLWTGSGGEYQEFRVKHSGKCIDLWFSGTQNGNKIDQHACNGTNAQKWKFQYIP